MLARVPPMPYRKMRIGGLAALPARPFRLPCPPSYCPLYATSETRNCVIQSCLRGRTVNEWAAHINAPGICHVRNDYPPFAVVKVVLHVGACDRRQLPIGRPIVRLKPLRHDSPFACYNHHEIGDGIHVSILNYHLHCPARQVDSCDDIGMDSGCTAIPNVVTTGPARPIKFVIRFRRECELYFIACRLPGG